MRQPFGRCWAAVLCAVLVLVAPLRAAASRRNPTGGEAAVDPASADAGLETHGGAERGTTARPTHACVGAIPRRLVPCVPAGENRRRLSRFPASLGRGALEVLRPDHLVLLAAGGTLASTGAFADAEIQRRLARREDRLARGLETAGDAPATVLVVGGLFAAGRLAGGPRFRATTFDLAGATAVNLGYTSLLKATVRRQRPDGSNRRSFPSGHTSYAFAAASVVERHYGWRPATPLFAAAGLMGYSRLVREKHHLSDVLAGAALGMAVGRSMVRANDTADPRPRALTWAVVPVVGDEAAGLCVRVSF